MPFFEDVLESCNHSSLCKLWVWFPFWSLPWAAKNGPIYDVAWSPSSNEFCAVYGFMPAKATVFNLKCDPVFDFGTGPRNAVFYSPQAHILVLAGFGNLQGHMEVWDIKKYKQVSKPQAADATHFSWCPDGEHIVTATCAPRLRVGNGFKVWHYTGTVLYKQDIPAGSELWEVQWQPFPAGTFPEKPIKYQAAPSELGTTEAKPTQAYRPPALRNKPVTATSKLVSSRKKLSRVLIHGCFSICQIKSGICNVKRLLPPQFIQILFKIQA